MEKPNDGTWNLSSAFSWSGGQEQVWGTQMKAKLERPFFFFGDGSTNKKSGNDGDV